ncbi:MAG: 23S rRNA (guanosine(2251)-2'-O)-methyltransferase RlmB, partial [Candidatus Accumulibacter sp.]|nr:23S rRNA (guanosine(2251)-2'-O)-methyltransferase RlmB [Accumulibacter sp.]
MSQTAFIHGFHAILAKLRHRPEAVLEIFIDAGRHDARARDLLKHAERNSVRVAAVDAARLDGMAGGGRRHQGVVARVSLDLRPATLDDVLDTLEEPPFLLILDGVQDPHNLGACLRVADAAGAHAVIAPKDRAAGLTQTAIKVASGAAESVPYVTVTNLARTLRELKERGVWIVGADAEAETGLYA